MPFTVRIARARRAQRRSVSRWRSWVAVRRLPGGVGEAGLDARRPVSREGDERGRVGELEVALVGQRPARRRGSRTARAPGGGSAAVCSAARTRGCRRGPGARGEDEAAVLVERGGRRRRRVEPRGRLGGRTPRRPCDCSCGAASASGEPRDGRDRGEGGEERRHVPLDDPSFEARRVGVELGLRDARDRCLVATSAQPVGGSISIRTSAGFGAPRIAGGVVQ